LAANFLKILTDAAGFALSFLKSFAAKGGSAFGGR
jgi:hypothetical protein